ncbi:MAG: OmpH family outer membrane protein [Gemmatimonadota bacterium]|nr:OmpH family outer membrane protein [Gemmatimonadota bacterium]
MSFVRMTGAACAALVLGVASSAAAQDLPPSGSSFVYLNSARVMQAAPGSADAQRTFDQELTRWRSELDTEVAVVDSLVRDYQRQEVMLSPQAKEQKQSEIREKQQALQTKRLELENRARERQEELLRPIIDRVTDMIEQIRAANGYAIVLDLASESVVAADPALDITDVVIQRLGAAPATPAAPAAEETP